MKIKKKKVKKMLRFTQDNPIVYKDNIVLDRLYIKINVLYQINHKKSDLIFSLSSCKLVLSFVIEIYEYYQIIEKG